MKFPESSRWNEPIDDRFNSSYGDRFGAFVIKDGGDILLCLVDDGGNPDMPEGTPKWEHVSVTVRNKRGVRLQRCPTWAQMCRVKEAFWDDSECVVQFHPPKSEYVNDHPFCLHLWRSLDEKQPMPPSIFV